MSAKKDELRNPLSNVRGLGAAKEGVEHWWAQRVTAIAILPLGIWFAYNLICSLASNDAGLLAEWLFNPFNALGMLFLIVAVTYHARLGLQVVIEDYIHCESKKIVLLLLVKYTYIAAAIIGALSIVKLHFFGV